MSILNQIRAAAATAEPLKATRSHRDGHTPYGVATILNEVLIAEGLAGDKPVAPQMMYNYTKNGQIDGVKHPSTTGVTFTDEQVIAFCARYVARVRKDRGIVTPAPKPEVTKK
jgi:hypothetical protein